jgi:hypothetical protein
MFGHSSSGPSIAVLLFLALMYFIPALVARQRKHPNSTAIMALDIFLGWTVLGWVVALVWALTAVTPKAPARA